MHTEQAELTQMVAEQTKEGIVLTFPEIREKKMIPGRIYQGADTRYLFHTAEEVVPFEKAYLMEVEGYTSNHPEKVALRAFQNHFNYRLAPEDIGAMILLDFGEYVSNNLKKCAPLFNGKVGKKKDIKVWLQAGQTMKTFEVLERSFKEWEEGVKKETNPAIRDALHPDFSSKNRIVDLVYSGLLMGAAKEFFEYSFSTLCGIPKIRVEGIKSDWEQVRKMAVALGSVKELAEIHPYYDWAVQTPLDSIIGLYDGREDVDFWASLIKHRNMSGSEGSSAGWLPGFNLYGAKNKLLPNERRWTARNPGYQCEHLQVPVTNVLLVSDNTVGIGNVDESIATCIGFTGYSEKDGYLKPVLGIDGFEDQENTKGKTSIKDFLNALRDRRFRKRG